MSTNARTFQVFKQNDRNSIAALSAIADENNPESVELHVSISCDPPRIAGTIEKVQDYFKDIDGNGTLFGHFELFLRFPAQNNQKQQITVKVIRRPGSDEVTISHAAAIEIERIIGVVASAQSHFKTYERTEAIDRVLGDELAEFYRKRESALVRLEETQQNLIQQQETHQIRLQNETEGIRTQIRKEGDEYKATLDDKYASRMRELGERQAALDERTKQIDDRASKHARRQHHRDMKDALKKLETDFKLSRGTGSKRRGIHAVFIVGIIAACAGIVYAVCVDPNLDRVQTWVKLGIGSLTLFAFLAAYLRWMNQWFSEHAEEEFRLKRLALDIDRASWLVETVSEWQAEHPDKNLPEELLRQLGGGLFTSTGTQVAEDEHPLNKLLGASAHLQLRTPGTTLDIDRKGLREMKKDSETALRG